MKLVNAFFILIIFTNCFGFKVGDMSSQLITRLKLGEGLNKIEVEKQGNSLINIPYRIPVSADRIFIVDYKNALLKVFLKNGKLDYIIGTPKQNKSSERVLGIKLSNPGLLSVSEDDEIYIQDRINPTVENKPEERDPFAMTTGFFAVREPIYLPSYILNIGSNKKEVKVIGVSGNNSEPFRYIESIVSGEKGKLFVVHRQSSAFELTYFVNGEVKGSISENEISIFKSEESKKYFIKLDTIVPDKSGSYALLLFSFTGLKDERFKFRRIYKYKYNQSEPEKMLKEFQNPSEVLLGILNNKDFVTWETEDSGESVKLLIHDQNGNHLSNKRISFNPPRTRWRETYIDYKDNFFSIKIDSGFLELYEWN